MDAEDRIDQQEGMAEALTDTITDVKQLSARVQALEAHKDSAFMEAFNAISLDMHAASGRPCPTCRLVSNIIGRPFGCYEFQARKKAGG